MDIWCIYVPPIRSSDLDTRTQRFNPDDLPSSRRSIILGDFNAHNSVWDPSWTNSDPMGDHLLDWSTSVNMEILNDGSPTHLHRSSGRLSAPDISFAHSSIRASWSILEDIGSDHFPIEIGQHCNAQTRGPAVRSFRKANWALYTTKTEDVLPPTLPQNTHTQPTRP